MDGNILVGYKIILLNSKYSFFISTIFMSNHSIFRLDISC